MQSMKWRIAIKLLALILVCFNFSLAIPSVQAKMTQEQLAAKIIPPFSLGEKDPNLPVYSLLNSAEKPTGYVFQTSDLIEIPGFSGTPINLLVQMDFEGNFIAVEVLEHNEPVFVSGHGNLPLDQFINQYANLNVAQNIKVMLSTETADSSKNQIDGVAMATASVRIINETILAAALEIARKKIKGLNAKPAAIAKKEYFEKMTWQQMIKNGLVTIQNFQNRDAEAIFKNTEGASLDPIATENPNGLFSEITVADLSIPTVAKNSLTEQSYKEINQHLGKTKVPILVIARGRHQLLNEDFVPASVPEKISVKQNDLVINMRDWYIDVELKSGIEKPQPTNRQAYVFLLDRRFGFDPAAPWTLHMQVKRAQGSFKPEIITRELTTTYNAPKRFFDFPKADLRQEDAPPWAASWRAQTANIIILSTFLSGLFYLLWAKQSWMATPQNLKILRPAILLFTLFFIGWYGQAQLSIVTVIAMVKTMMVTPDLSFLLYDPLSTCVWAAVLISFFLWGRGTFCGWLCPYGVMQEFSAKLGGWLGVKQIKITYNTDKALKHLKYLILAAIIITAIFWPLKAEIIAEVEPFKTAITLYFWREWPFMIYAIFWLILSMFIFKAFCRYICPLGAFLSLGGRLRFPNWIERRKECGSPCQLCKARCAYQAIEPKGKITYAECFQCLDCVSIYDDKKQCVPLILQDKKNGA